jgi:hydroxyacylglutathione hydrolase
MSRSHQSGADGVIPEQHVGTIPARLIERRRAALPNSGGELPPLVFVLEMRHHAMKNFNYLVVDPASLRAVIVDPAWEIDKIDRTLQKTHATLSGVLLTHSHPDHIHLSRTVAQKYGCPIWMSTAEIAWSGFSAPELIGIDASPWTIGQMQIEPIPTPGHTPGSTCYLIGENLFTGDVLFAEGCGICPGIQAAHAMFASIERLKRRLEPQTRVFPGHSYGKPPGLMMSQLRRENIYLQFSDKDKFAAFRLRSGQNRARMFTFS